MQFMASIVKGRATHLFLPAAIGGNLPTSVMMLHVVLWPKIPHMCAGMRIEPPMSLPTPSNDPAALISAPSPPELPPEMRDKS